MRRLFAFVTIAALSFALGWLLHRQPSAREPAVQEPRADIEVLYPDPSAGDGRSRRRLHVVAVKRPDAELNSPVQAPKTDPAHTWIITFGHFGEPGWYSFVAIDN